MGFFFQITGPTGIPLANEGLGGTSADFDKNAYTLNVGAISAKIDEQFQGLLKAINPLDTEIFGQLETYANSVQSAFGLSKERVDEFKTTIADAAPELAKLGLQDADISNNLISIMQGLGGAASVSKEAIVELSAAAKLTGQDVGTLTTNFRDVGISVYDVGEQMKTVTEVARSAGVSVNKVSGQVMTNLEKMNLFNFENGVKGLAKMAAQAERLGINMAKVFAQTEKVMNPEGAIEMSASLQRLGVASSGLLDPLRAMDMSQNDPEQFQKEMVNLGKEFTRFNEKTGQTEILPGAKRRMKEVAEAVGMTAEEFSKMAIKSSDFEMKLKQIKMPSLSVDDDETKEMIATMAQMKDGVATIQVRDKETGITTEKKVEELTPEDIENLKKANEDSSKTIEELAFNQLDVTTQIKNLLSTGEVAAKFAKATTPTLSKFYGLVADSKLEIAKASDNIFGSTEDMRTAIGDLSKPVEGIIKGKITGDDKMVNTEIGNLETNILKTFSDFTGKFSTEVNSVQEKLIENVKTAYSEPIKIEGKTDSNLNINVKVTDNGGNLIDDAKLKRSLLDDPNFISSLKTVTSGVAAP
jgi:ribosomal protein S13